MPGDTALEESSQKRDIKVASGLRCPICSAIKSARLVVDAIAGVKHLDGLPKGCAGTTPVTLQLTLPITMLAAVLLLMHDTNRSANCTLDPHNERIVSSPAAEMGGPSGHVCNSPLSG